MSTPLELRVVSGRPDDTELAALVAVLLAAASRWSRPPTTTRAVTWGHPVTLVRRGGPQPGGWDTPRL